MMTIMALAGCAGNLHETISVHVDDVACTERIYAEDKSSITSSVTGIDQSANIRGSVSLKSPITGGDSQKPDRRCDPILKSASATAELNKKIKAEELRKMQLSARLQELEVERQEARKKYELEDLDADW